MWTLWYSINIAVKIKVDSIVWWNLWSKVDYTRSVYIDYDTRTQEWNDVSINNSSRSAQDNHWKSLIEKKSNFDRFCKRLINIIIEDSNIKICCFESKQSISISQIWVKRNLQNKTKELDYLNSIITLTIILKRLTNQKLMNQFIESVWFIESVLIWKQSTQVDLDQLRLFQSTEKKKLVNIVMIEVVVYQTLVKNKKIRIFFLIISEINKALSSVKDFAKLNKMIFVMSLDELKKKLSIVYHDFLNVFNREKITQLSSHQSYDHKIELEDESQLSRSRLYLILSYKLQKIKEYLEENLKKKFITLSKASFASSILFVEKKDDSLRFCVNYWKLNALIKRNRYSIFLIDEVLARIQDSKYLT